MSNFLKDIFEGKTNEFIHHNFTRYGKGEYERLLFTIKKGKNLAVKSSFDFANEFIKLIAEHGKGKLSITGKIICGRDFKDELPCEAANYSKRGKLYTAEINTEMSPEELKKLYEKFRTDFLLLNISGENAKLKVGKSLPKPGGTIKDNFCSATLPVGAKDEFAWDVSDFKELLVKHIVNVQEIAVNQELMKKDPAKARLEAIRKGIITRILSIDGKEEKRESLFSA